MSLASEMERAGAGRLACRAVHRCDVGVGEGRISGKFLHFDEAWGTQEDPLAGERLSELIERAVERSLRQARTPNRVVPGGNTTARTSGGFQERDERRR